MTCPLCGLDTESPLGHLLLCGARFKREAEQAQAALDDSRERHGYLPCARCGKRCGQDAVVADDVWARIAPKPGDGGMLCVWCIDELCAELGLSDIPVRIYFIGKALYGDWSVTPEREADTVRAIAKYEARAALGQQL